MNIELIKYLVSINKELIERTAIKNCHCIGLNSFIINEKPKMRLFIADDNCELYFQNETNFHFDYKNPIIAIHPHKYDDVFFQLQGSLVHHFYSKAKPQKSDMPCFFNKYKYLRLSDSNKKIELVGTETIYYEGSNWDVKTLKSNTLHTASLSKYKAGFNISDKNKDKSCAWVVIETFEDKNFEQIGYQNNLSEFLKKQPLLYKKFPNSYDYVSHFINKL
jgi:hypothetical protein